MFQHTAARRRLAPDLLSALSLNGFNTQPPEGGWNRPVMPMRLLFLFQHTAARRRLGLSVSQKARPKKFQHTAARRRLVDLAYMAFCNEMFQHTAARRRLVAQTLQATMIAEVSTHSRPKAAG